MNVDSSVVPDMLIDLSLLPPRTRIITTTCPSSFEYFHPTLSFPLAYTFVTILNCLSSVNFTSFHTVWTHKSGHTSLSIFGAFWQ